MLGDADAMTMIPVKDLNQGAKFYEETLGLKKVDENPGGIVFQSGDSQLFVYASEFAGTNRATAVSWTVEDIEDTARGLKAKGVKFEHYDIPGATHEEGSDIHAMGSIKAVWFKDPDGNILSATSQMG